MQVNNEHIVLRRRMERRLGRSVSRAAWEIAAKHDYVADALESVGRDRGEPYLLKYLEELLHVEDEAVLGAARRSPTPTPLSAWKSANLMARIEAVSRLAGEHAAGDDEILRLRQRVLGRDTPMSREEAEAYLDLPEARRPRRSGVQATGPMELLRYQNAHVAHDLHVSVGSPLDELRKLAERLSRSYPWEPAQAAAFVLEGLVPLATSFMLRFPQTWHERRPTRAKLIMEVDVWMPVAAVLRAYRDVQRHVLPGHNRPISRRSIDVVNFVMLHRPATWAKLLELWNTEHPNAPYADYRRFRYTFERASRSLLFPRYRPYMGPEPGPRVRTSGSRRLATSAPADVDHGRQTG